MWTAQGSTKRILFLCSTMATFPKYHAYCGAHAPALSEPYLASSEKNIIIFNVKKRTYDAWCLIFFFLSFFFLFYLVPLILEGFGSKIKIFNPIQPKISSNGLWTNTYIGLAMYQKPMDWRGRTNQHIGMVGGTRIQLAWRPHGPPTPGKLRARCTSGESAHAKRVDRYFGEKKRGRVMGWRSTCHPPNMYIKSFM